MKRKQKATKKMERIIVTIPFSLFNDMSEFCEKRGETRSDIVREAVRQYINKLRREEMESLKYKTQTVSSL